MYLLGRTIHGTRHGTHVNSIMRNKLAKNTLTESNSSENPVPLEVQLLDDGGDY